MVTGNVDAGAANDISGLPPGADGRKDLWHVIHIRDRFP